VIFFVPYEEPEASLEQHVESALPAAKEVLHILHLRLKWQVAHVYANSVAVAVASAAASRGHGFQQSLLDKLERIGKRRKRTRTKTK